MTFADFVTNVFGAGEPREVSADPGDALARERRAERRLARACINGTTAATHGCRCRRCYLTHKYTAAEARQMPEYKAAPICNPTRWS